LSSSSAWRFPGLLPGNPIDIIASTCSWVTVLLPQVLYLKRLLTWSWAGWLQLWLMLLCLHFSIKRGVLPGQLGHIGLCWDLVHRKSQGGKVRERQCRDRYGGERSEILMNS